MGRAGIRLGLFVAAALALTACDELTTSPRPTAREPAKPAVPLPIEPSPASQELAAYYRAVENNLLTQGLLRTDGGGPDTPFSKRSLVQNFIKVGVFGEFNFEGSDFVPGSRESVVRRFQEPVRVKLDFSAEVPNTERAEIRTSVRRYLARLSRATGHPISLATDDANFLVAVLSVDAMAAYPPQLQAFLPRMEANFAARMVTLARTDHCVVYTFNDAELPNVIDRSVAIIRAEHPKLLREKCLHEEIAQGLGLSNDSPAARPSIFNDDDEFALLTRHDELLLQILYDNRLPLGATPQQARPVVEVLAAELLGGET